MKQVELTKGYVALVDDEDYERVAQFKWRAQRCYFKDGTVRNVYACRTGKGADGKWNVLVMLHRFVVGIADMSMDVDHGDHDGLNCQRHNLRVCSHSQNNANNRVRITSRSGYKGVTWHKPLEKWVANIRIEGRLTYLGLFPSKEQAALAYNQAAERHFGEFAYLNSVTTQENSTT
jgi:hypothetical protein